MTTTQLLADTTRNPFQDYLTGKAPELWTVLLVGIVFAAVFWLLETRSDVRLPAQILVAPWLAVGLSALLLIMSI